MTRILFIGNSHVGAFKRGWGRIGGGASNDLTFFGVPHPYFNRMVLEDDLRFALPAPTTHKERVAADKINLINGATAVSLADSDLVVWAGYAVPHGALARIAIGFDIDGLRETGAPCTLSRAAFDAACDGMIEQRLPAPRWRGWSRPRLLLLPVAMPSEDIFESADPKNAPWQRLGRNPVGFPAVVEAYFARFAIALEPLEIGLLRQPAETLCDSGLTAHRWSRGSARMSGKDHPDDDFIHMNDDYGALALERMAPMRQMA